MQQQHLISVLMENEDGFVVAISRPVLTAWL